MVFATAFNPVWLQGIRFLLQAQVSKSFSKRLAKYFDFTSSNAMAVLAVSRTFLQMGCKIVLSHDARMDWAVKQNSKRMHKVSDHMSEYCL